MGDVLLLLTTTNHSPPRARLLLILNVLSSSSTGSGGGGDGGCGGIKQNAHGPFYPLLHPPPLAGYSAFMATPLSALYSAFSVVAVLRDASPPHQQNERTTTRMNTRTSQLYIRRVIMIREAENALK